MLAEHLAALRCPHCRGTLAAVGGALRCPDGHSFDIARQGYVTLVPPRAPGDSAEMIAARMAIQDSGFFEPLAGELETLVGRHAPASRLVVDIGSGPGYYAANLASSERRCLCLDSSKFAARRAARRHPSVAAVVADCGAELPLANGCADVVLDVFAPRNVVEFRRIAAATGLLVVVIPQADHLAAVRERVSMLSVETGKWQRLQDSMSPSFELIDDVSRRWSRELDRELLRQLVLMGPSAFHTEPDALDAELAQLPGSVEVEAAIRIACFTPR